ADPAFVKHLFAPEQLGPAATADLAFQDAAAGDDAQPRDLDGDEDLDLAFADLSIRRLAQTLGGALDVLGQLVDDVVVANLDLGPLRRRRRGRRRVEVEANDDRVGDAREQKVRVADGADTLTHDLDRDHWVFDLLERVEEGLEG